MIALPPGCTVTYSVWIDIESLSEDIIEWYRSLGEEVRYDRHYNSRGKEVLTPYVRYGQGKWCHHHHNGTPGAVRLHFLGKDASVASMFILKFNDFITNHNLRDVMERQERELAP